MRLSIVYTLVFLVMTANSAYAACASPTASAGTWDYFGAPDNTFKFCNGTSWIAAGADNLGSHAATQTLDLNGHKIVELADPTSDQDAATKAYVDASGGGASFAGSGTDIAVGSSTPVTIVSSPSAKGTYVVATDLGGSSCSDSASGTLEARIGGSWISFARARDDSDGNHTRFPGFITIFMDGANSLYTLGGEYATTVGEPAGFVSGLWDGTVRKGGACSNFSVTSHGGG